MKKSDRKFAFTIAAIEKLPAPQGKAREFYFDSKIEGLWLQVTKAGSKTFLVRKWVNGKVQAVTLGPGSHRVAFSYSPPYLGWALAAFAAGCAALCVLALRCRSSQQPS